MIQTSSQSTVNKIEMRLRGKGRGSIVFQQDYADCGTPSAVKSTFHRMYTDGMLVRLAHGIYYYPKEDKEYGLGIIYPSVEDIAQAIAKRDKAKIVPMGAYALNSLGLSTHSSTLCHFQSLVILSFSKLKEVVQKLKRWSRNTINKLEVLNDCGLAVSTIIKRKLNENRRKTASFSSYLIYTYLFYWNVANLQLVSFTPSPASMSLSFWV